MWAPLYAPRPEDYGPPPEPPTPEPEQRRVWVIDMDCSETKPMPKIDYVPIGLHPRRLWYGGVPYEASPIEYPFALTETSFIADFPWHFSEGVVTCPDDWRPAPGELRGILRGVRPTLRYDLVTGK